MSEPGAVFSSYQTSPGGTAVGSGDISLSEANALFCNPIDMGRGNFLVSLTAKFAVSQVVSQKNDQVGHPFLFLRMQNGKKGKQDDQKRVDFIHEKRMS